MEITVFPLLAIWFLLFFVLAIVAWRSAADAETQRRLVLAASFMFCYTLCVHLCSALFCCCGVQCSERRRRGSRSRPQQAEEDDDAPPPRPAAVAAADRHRVLMSMMSTTNTALLRGLHALFVLTREPRELLNSEKSEIWHSDRSILDMIPCKLSLPHIHVTSR